jgi:hypothetical protein
VIRIAHWPPADGGTPSRKQFVGIITTGARTPRNALQD